MTNETKRKIEHIVPVVFAFLLRYLNTWQALAFAFAGIIYGYFFSKILVKSAFRVHEQKKGFSGAKLIYGIMVFILILLFHKKMYIVAGAWAIMSCGDGCSALFGTAYGRKTLPWNAEKTWIGTVAFIFFGTLGAVILMWWVNMDQIHDPLTLHHIVTAAFFATLTAAVVESLQTGINDNITVPLTAGLTLYASSLLHWENLGNIHSIVAAFGINVTFGLLAYYLKTVSKSGLIGGVLIGTIIYLCLGIGGFAILFTFFVAGSWASKHKYNRKSMYGIAQENQGKRGIKHAMAKGGVGLVMAVMALLTDTPGVFTIAFVAAFATAAFDTISSELGQIYGKKTVLITTLKPVPSGTNGAVSIEGTVLGFMAALFIGIEAFILHLIPLPSIVVVIIAAFAGTTVESILGATIEQRKWANNEVINFINISTGAGIAILFIKVMGI